MSPRFDWLTAISQSARAGYTLHSFDRYCYRTVQNHFLSVNSRSPRGSEFVRTRVKVSQLVNRCFEPSQPYRIISGLGETFIKRYKVERTNNAEIRLEEQSEKVKSCRENLWNTVERATETETDTKTEWKGERHKPQHPHHMKVSPWGRPARNFFPG